MSSPVVPVAKPQISVVLVLARKRRFRWKLSQTSRTGLPGRLLPVLGNLDALHRAQRAGGVESQDSTAILKYQGDHQRHELDSAEDSQIVIPLLGAAVSKLPAAYRQ